MEERVKSNKTKTCDLFSKGKCPFGDTCVYSHDPAICVPDYLERKGNMEKMMTQFPSAARTGSLKAIMPARTPVSSPSLQVAVRSQDSGRGVSWSSADYENSVAQLDAHYNQELVALQQQAEAYHYADGRSQSDERSEGENSAYSSGGEGL